MARRTARHWISALATFAVASALLMAIAVVATSARADVSTTEPGVTSKRISSKSDRPRGGLPEFTAEREAAALTFVDKHHPELADLLRQLRDMDVAAYESAIRQLFKESESLADLQARDAPRYALTLRAWKIDSRIQLMAARHSMAPSPAMAEELRALLADRQRVRNEQQVNTRDRLQAKVEELTAGIAQDEQTFDEQVDKQFERLVRQLSGSGLHPSKAMNNAGDKTLPVVSPTAKSTSSGKESASKVNAGGSKTSSAKTTSSKKPRK